MSCVWRNIRETFGSAALTWRCILVMSHSEKRRHIRTALMDLWACAAFIPRFLRWEAERDCNGTNLSWLTFVADALDILRMARESTLSVRSRSKCEIHTN